MQRAVGGCIRYKVLDYNMSLGFVTMGTNDGRDSTTGVPFLENLDVIEDFAYRALHTGEDITKTLYSETH